MKKIRKGVTVGVLSLKYVKSLAKFQPMTSSTYPFISSYLITKRFQKPRGFNFSLAITNCSLAQANEMSISTTCHQSISIQYNPAALQSHPWPA